MTRRNDEEGRRPKGAVLPQTLGQNGLILSRRACAEKEDEAVLGGAEQGAGERLGDGEVELFQGNLTRLAGWLE